MPYITHHEKTRLTWYCCVQCANHLRMRQRGAWRRPLEGPEEVWGAEPGWTRVVNKRWRRRLHTQVAQQPDAAGQALCAAFPPPEPIGNWADSVDVKFGSF